MGGATRAARRISAGIAFAGVLALAGRVGLAQAAGWAAFGPAFPLFPCQDGWMGCMVGGAHVEPEMVKDGNGRLLTANARVGWFDLRATPGFSPFTGLSVYEVTRVAAAEPAPEVAEAPPPANDAAVEQAAADAELARAAKVEADRARDQAEKERRAAELQAEKERQAEAEARKAAADAARRASAAAQDAQESERLKREAEAARQQAAQMEQQRIAAEKAAAEKVAAEKAAAAKAAEQLRAQQEAQAAADLAAKEAAARDLAAREAAARDAAAKEAAARDAAAKEAATQTVTPTPPEPVVEGDCADLQKLEPLSLLGKLPDSTLTCLETRLANSPKMTDKKRISGVLMANAWAKADKAGWEALVKRHLDEIDQSDPDLCYKYALHLSRQGPSRANGVIRWANVALENRMVWIGETYTSRVYSLYKIRAAASQALWQAAESDHASSPSDDSREKVEKYRNMTKVNAREWYEYAKNSGKDSSTALQLCMSAAGTADYCES